MKKQSIKDKVNIEIEKFLLSKENGAHFSEIVEHLKNVFPEVNTHTILGYLWRFTLKVKKGELSNFEWKDKRYRFRR